MLLSGIMAFLLVWAFCCQALGDDGALVVVAKAEGPETLTDPTMELDDLDLEAVAAAAELDATSPTQGPSPSSRQLTELVVVATRLAATTTRLLAQLECEAREEAAAASLEPEAGDPSSAAEEEASSLILGTPSEATDARPDEDDSATSSFNSASSDSNAP